MGSLEDKMKELNADGIDFMSIFSYEIGREEIIASYTKEQFECITYIPKTAYKYWKIENGKKIYLNFKNE